MKKLFLLFLSFALLNSSAWAFEWFKLRESESDILFVDLETVEAAVNNKQNIKEFWVKNMFLDDTPQKKLGVPQDVAVFHFKLKANCKNKTFAIAEVRMWDLQEDRMIDIKRVPVSKLNWSKMENDDHFGLMAKSVCDYPK
ncbi:MAG: hypothetical protein J6T41_00990 [Neisseriaceae bacterium]|nr:hypothetical protein [Neisseriaceae bacterium]